MKTQNNWYTRILSKLDKFRSEAYEAVDKGNDLIDPELESYCSAIRYYMQLKDKDKGFFAAQVILEDWFLNED